MQIFFFGKTDSDCSLSLRHSGSVCALFLCRFLSLSPTFSFPLSLAVPRSLARFFHPSLSHTLSRFVLFLSLFLSFFRLPPRCFCPSHALSLSFSVSLARSVASSLHLSLAIPLFLSRSLGLSRFPSLARSLAFSLHPSLTRSLAMTLFFSRSLNLSLPLFFPLSVSLHPSLWATPLWWISALSVEACDFRINLNVQRFFLEFATPQYIIHSLPCSPFLTLCLSLSFSLPRSLSFSLANSHFYPPHTPSSLSSSLFHEPVVDLGAQRRCV